MPVTLPPRIAFDVHLTGAAFAFLYFHPGWNLGRWLPDLAAWRRRRAVAKSDLRIHQVDDDELEESYRGRDEEGDRILDKLHRDGELSLPPDERRTLEAYSRRMRQKHR